MCWQEINKSYALPFVCGLFAASCLIPPWCVDSHIVMDFIWSPPRGAHGIAWSILLCQWALVLLAVFGIKLSWKKFLAGFCAFIVGCLICALVPAFLHRQSEKASKETETTWIRTESGEKIPFTKSGDIDWKAVFPEGEKGEAP